MLSGVDPFSAAPDTLRLLRMQLFLYESTPLSTAEAHCVRYDVVVKAKALTLDINA